MTIIFLSRYQEKVERGVENYVSELSSRLSKKHKVLVLTSIKQLIGKKARLALRAKRADIIYPLNGYWQTLFCRIYSWLIGAKLVLGGHAGIGRDDRWNLYMFPDLFIAFSQKGYEWARKVNPFIKIIKIHHGIDLQKFSPQVKPVKIDLEKPIFVTVSHLEPYKRVDLTVKAVSRLKKGSLLVLGEGPEAKKIDGLGQKLLGNKRYLRLQASHNKVASYLTASDVFTLVSEGSEAFGLVYLEAMACGLSVVATNDELRRELVGGAGIMVNEPENSFEYAGALERATEFDWGDKSVRQAREYDWEKIAIRYLEEFTCPQSPSSSFGGQEGL